MKLYIKGERRYREAKRSEILSAAVSIIDNLQIRNLPLTLDEITTLLKAQEETETKTETLRRVAQKEKP